MTKEQKAAYEEFSKDARMQGGEYLIMADGEVLVDPTPRGLFDKYLEAKGIEPIGIARLAHGDKDAEEYLKSITDGE